jgi:hypothetical protein
VEPLPCSIELPVAYKTVIPFSLNVPSVPSFPTISTDLTHSPLMSSVVATVSKPPSSPTTPTRSPFDLTDADNYTSSIDTAGQRECPRFKTSLGRTSSAGRGPRGHVNHQINLSYLSPSTDPFSSQTSDMARLLKKVTLSLKI